MSEHAVDPKQVEQTRRQIRGLVTEIARLANSDVPPEEFYPAFLTRVVGALGAPGGAVWVLEDNRLRLQYQINLQQTGLQQSQESLQQHGKLLMQVLANGRGHVVPPRSGAGNAGSAGSANPTDLLLVLGPLTVDQERVGIVEVFQRPGAQQAAQQGYLRFLGQVCALASDYLKSRKLRGMVDRQHLWSQLEAFSRQVHTSLKPRSVAYTIANDGRQLIGCDRVSVAVRQGRRTRVEAISGQDVVDRRANLVRAMARLADAVLHAGDPLLFFGETEDLPPRIEEALQEYIDESGTKAIYVVPFRAPAQQPDEKTPPLGALVVEQIDESQPAPGLTERSEIVARHGETALANAIAHDRVFLLPFSRWVGERLGRLRGNTLAKFLVVLVALVAVLGSLVVIPGSFRLEGKGKLLPKVRREVFAGEEGIVREIRVAHGDRVNRDQVLVELENIDLAVRLQQAKAELMQTRDQLRIKSAQRGDRTLSQAEQIKLSGELLTLERNAASLEREIALLENRTKRLTVRSPIDGIVMTWDLERRLANRPVQRGNLLMSVADDRGPWVLEVQVPEGRIGHILEANGKLEQDERLAVEYILATDPEQRYAGWLEEIAARTQVVEEEGNVVVVTVEPDPNDLPPLRPGAEVRARILCGRRPLGYVWFHELIEFVQARILF